MSQNSKESSEALAPKCLKKIWGNLSQEEQSSAFQAFFLTTDYSVSSSRKKLMAVMAENLRFRQSTIQKSPIDKKVEMLRKVHMRKEFNRFFDDFIRAWLIEHRKPMLIAFLDGASVPHENGFSEEDQPPTVQQFEKGIKSLQGIFTPRDIAIYICYLGLFAKNDDYWNALRETSDYQDILSQFLTEDDDKKSGNDDPPKNEVNDQIRGATVLDDWLIRLAVSTAFGEEGAPEEDVLENIVEEIVELNASRHRSLFHRGFFHALFGRDFEFSFAGENNARRQWYACGLVFGLIRANRTNDAIQVLVHNESGIGKEIITSSATPCGAKLLPLMVQPLLEEDHLDYVCQFTSSQLCEVADEAARQRVCYALHQRAIYLMRHGIFSKSEKLVDQLIKIVADEENNLSNEFVLFIIKSTLCRKAQCQQAKGSFTKAKDTLDAISSDGNDLPANAIADRGLIEGSFRKLSAILPKPTLGENKGLVDALKKGLHYFEKAVEQYEDKATNAHFCLGVLKTLDGDHTGSARIRADHFGHALGGMLEDPTAYEVEGFIHWTNGLLALALLETVEQSEYTAAFELISDLLKSEVRFPNFLWQRMFHASALFDDKSLALMIGEHLVNTGEDALDCLLQNAKIFSSKDDTLNAVLRKTLIVKVPVKREWERLVNLLPIVLQAGAIESAETILDRLESLAIKDDFCRKCFITLLEDSNHYSPAWDSSEADELRVRLLEIEGRSSEASEILRASFYRLKTGGAPHELFAARRVLESIKDLAATGVNVQELESMLPSQDLPQAAAENFDCRVLYIGGNETQKGYESRLQWEIQNKHSGITVEFSFPGWSSNWNVDLEKLKPKIKQADVVVINSLIRTQLGRHLRAACDGNHPWLPCTGRGLDSLKRTIVDAARWVSQLKR